jgi:hypothetical protein
MVAFHEIWIILVSQLQTDHRAYEEANDKKY